MHDRFIRLTSWASVWSGSPQALAVFTVLALAWTVWGIVSGVTDVWSGVGGGFTGWAALILLVLMRSAQIRQDEQQASDTSAILSMAAELVRALDQADNAVIPD